MAVPSTSQKNLILKDAVEKIGVNDHLCLIYENQEEQFAAVVPFIRVGLERGEKCVYIVDENTAATVLSAMRSGGIDTDAAVKSGSLVIATKREAYLKQGYFDPDLMISFLGASTENAIKEGYTALRVTGEMTWALGGDTGTERLIEYEAKLNYFFPYNKVLAICQYNRNRFSPEIILNIIKTHPLVIYGEFVCKNPFYIPPDEFLKPEQPFREVERLLKTLIAREESEKALQNEISVRMEKEKELRQALDSLARSNKDLEQFAYVASHDLQEPLRMVSSFVKLLEERCKDKLDDDARTYINYAIDGTNRMHMLINDLLLYSRVQTRKQAFETVDCAVVLERALSNLRLLIEESGARISIGPLPLVEVDGSQFLQLLQNLISNAIKFRKPDVSPDIEISAELKGKQWVFSVRDNGIGIDAKNFEKIFGLFQRINGFKYQGSGIGLAVCKRIVERHNGRIWVESELGKGSNFLFSIPVKSTDNPVY